MPDDQHPADGLIQTIRGIFNGDTFAQGIKDAWDAHMHPQPAPAAEPAQTAPINWDAFKQADARNRAMTAASAANVRSKAGKAMGK